MTEYVIVGWHHRFNGHKFEQTLGYSERQGSLACCSPLGHRESGTTEQLKNSSEDIEILLGKDAAFVFSHTEFEVPVGQPGGDAQ